MPETTTDPAQPRLSADDARTLEAVLDEIIPASEDRALPGAGAAGGVAHIEGVLAKSPELGPLLRDGLAAARDAAGRRGSGGFAALSRADRLEVLNEVSDAHPALIPSLIFHSYIGYYLNPRVQEALGLEARPPHPLGYTFEADDLSLLDEVRARPRLYRDC